MQIQDRKLRVLARFPDLSVQKRKADGPGAYHELWGESRRFISQGISLRMMSMLAAILFVAAIFPYSRIWQGDAPGNAPTAAPASDMALKPAETVDGPAPAATEAAFASPTLPDKPAVALYEAPPAAPQNAVPPTAAEDDASRMSSWPNPAYSNPALTADARANWIAPPAGSPTLGNSPQTPANQGHYDRSRSSIR